MIKIAPSILSADFCNLERDIQRVSSADYLHVDVMDGAFVPNITIGVPVLKSIRKHTDMFLDVHLMIEKPVRYIEAFAQAGADLLSVHLEADHPTQIAQALNVTARYAGEEPSSQVTGLYNRVMAQELPKKGIRFVEVPRASQDGVPISASTVRKLIHDGNLGAIRPLVPEPTWQFFHTPEARPVIAAIQAAGNVVHY